MMSLTLTQRLYSILIGFLIGLILPKLMDEKVIMPYVKSIGCGVIGALLGAVIYSLKNSLPANNKIISCSILGAIVFYFIVRAFSNKQNPDSKRTIV
jgi:hypothetical protein